MKKFLLFIVACLMTFSAVCLSGCINSNGNNNTGNQKPAEKNVISQHEVTMEKGVAVTVSAIVEDDVVVKDVKWVAADNTFIDITKNDFDIEIKGRIAGSTTVNLYIKNKLVDTMVVNVVEPDLYVMLPQKMIVVSKGQTATVKAVTKNDGEVVWQSQSSYITLNTQNLICRLTVSADCPDGEYVVTVKQGTKSFEFTVVVGK